MVVCDQTRYFVLRGSAAARPHLGARRAVAADVLVQLFFCLLRRMRRAHMGPRAHLPPTLRAPSPGPTLVFEPELVQVGPTLARARPVCGRTQPISISGPGSTKGCPCLVNTLARVWPTLARIRPTSTNICPVSAKTRPKSTTSGPEVGPMSSKFVQDWPVEGYK